MWDQAIEVVGVALLDGRCVSKRHTTPISRLPPARGRGQVDGFGNVSILAGANQLQNCFASRHAYRSRATRAIATLFVQVQEFLCRMPFLCKAPDTRGRHDERYVCDRMRARS